MLTSLKAKYALQRRSKLSLWCGLFNKKKSPSQNAIYYSGGLLFSFSSTFIIRSQSHDIINITIVMAKHTYRLIRGTNDLNHQGRLRPKKLVLSAKLFISGIKTCYGSSNSSVPVRGLLRAIYSKLPDETCMGHLLRTTVLRPAMGHLLQTS